jgi:hypothetical protein
MFVTRRDFLYLSGKILSDDGTIWIITTSIERPENPPINNAIRGNILFAGWKLTPIEKNGK